MAIYQGNDLTHDGVSLRQPDLDEISLANKINDTNLDWEKYRKLALNSESVYYFAIYFGDQLVGEIFLHDINPIKKESLVGYYIFNPSFRGKGIGTKALNLLQKFVKQNMDLNKLIIITSEDNIPSRKIAEKSGFICNGPSLEDPKRTVYVWEIKRP